MAPKKTPSLRSWLKVTPLEDRVVPATLIDRNATFVGSGNASAVVLGTSDSGRFAIFSSKATDLIAGQVDVPGTADLFWTDLLTGEIKLVTNLPSAQANGVNVAQTNYQYDGVTTYSRVLPGIPAFSQAAISGDGKFVAFNTTVDVSLIDRLYITKAISPNSTDITRTTAPDRGNSTLDVFRWSSTSGVTSLASRTYFNVNNVSGTGGPTNPNQAFGRRTEAVNPAISTDGSRVSFVSSFNANGVLPQRVFPVQPAGVRLFTNGAENLVIDNGDTSDDIFVTDFTDIGTAGFTPMQEDSNLYYTTVMSKIFTGDRTPFTVDSRSTPAIITDLSPFPFFETFGNRGSTQIQVDPLGRYLGGDGLTATFVSNVDASLLNLRSAASGTFNRRNYAASSSNNVYWTQFGSTADIANIVRLVTTGADTVSTGKAAVSSTGGSGGVAQNAILSRNDSAGVLFLTSVGATPAGQIVPNFSGSTTTQQLYFRRMNDEIGDTAFLVSATSANPTSTGNGALPIIDPVNGAIDPASYQVAANGSAAVFTSSSSNTFPAATVKDTNNANDVFVKDLVTGTIAAVSVIPSGKQTGASAANTPNIGPDGQFVTFQSVGTDYSATPVTDTNGVTDILLRDRTANTTAYISTIANGATTGNGASTGAYIGNLGTNGRISFTSSATNLDTNFPITPGNTDGYVTTLPLNGAGSNDPPLKAARIGAVSGGSPAAAAYVTFGPASELVVGSKFTPFPGYTGEIRVATADVNGDGNAQPDLIAAAGPGIAPRVVVIDGATGKTIYNLTVFEASFTGGLNVAAADLNGDGKADIIVAADIGGGPRVKIIDGATGKTLSDFFVFESSFRGGVRLSTGFIGSITATGFGQTIDDNVPDIIAGAGIGGGPRVSVLDGASAVAGRVARITDFFAYEQSLRNGVYVSAGDFNKDTVDDIVTGGGPGGGPRVQVFEAKSLVLTPNTPTTLINFFAFNEDSRNGVRVSAKNIDGDSVADILVGEGAGNIGRVRSFAGGKLDSSSRPTLIDDTILFDDFAATNGAWVG